MGELGREVARLLGMEIRAQGLREEGESLGWTPAGKRKAGRAARGEEKRL
jgi:hypothetical protein